MCSEKEEKEKEKGKEKDKEKEKEKEKGKEKGKEKEKNRLQLQPGPFGEINFDYSYRRASAGELISHYITVGPFPEIRNVIIFAAMVLLGDIDLNHLAHGSRIVPGIMLLIFLVVCNYRRQHAGDSGH